MKLFLFFTIVLLAWGCSSQSKEKALIFEIQKSRLPSWDSIDCNNVPWESRRFINFKNDSSDINAFSFPIEYTDSLRALDTLAAIGELLTFEGNTVVSCKSIKAYNFHFFSLYTGSERCISLQVEALFIINQLFFKNPFEYSIYPVIKDGKNNQYESISGPIIKRAYMAYRNWFKKIRTLGIENSRRKEIYPLDGTINVVEIKT